MIKFKERLRELRIERKIEQTKLAQDLNVSQQTISHWENGDNEPDFETLEQIAKYFDVTADYILGMTDY